METLLILARGIPWTIALTVCAFMLGAILGFPLLAMRLSNKFVLRGAANGIIVLLRSIPQVVWLFIVFFGIGNKLFTMTPFIATVAALGIVTGANMAEIYRGALMAIHPGQYEAAKVLNLTRLQQFRDVVLPQLVRVALPTAAAYLIGLMKDTAIASTIGTTDIAFQAYRVTQDTFRGLGVYGVAGLIYIALSIPVAWFARWSDSHLRSRVSR